MARPRHEEAVGVAAWLRRWWRALLAELLSTALLVWLGCAALVPVDGPGTVVLTHPALAFGFIVAANVCAFGAISGAHMNPAVTLGALLYGQLDVLPAIGYVLAQVLGATLGFGGLLATSPPELTAGVAITLPAANVSPMAAMALELVITAVLVLTVCGVWAEHDSARPDTTVALKLGVVVSGLIYAVGPSTGASLNPARSFAPALFHGIWQDQWVYWVGPLLGAALAAPLHRYVLTRRAPAASAPHDAEMPLHDKP